MTQHLVQKVGGVWYRPARMTLSYLLIATGVYSGGCQELSCYRQTPETKDIGATVSEQKAEPDAGVERYSLERKLGPEKGKDDKPARSATGRERISNDTAEDIFGKGYEDEVSKWFP